MLSRKGVGKHVQAQAHVWSRLTATKSLMVHFFFLTGGGCKCVLPDRDVHTVLDDTNEENLLVFKRCETTFKRCSCSMRELGGRKS